ncbi:MAG: sulfite exporter TauE/SafE family protein [Candidatus Paceibacterota bacterium]|jgi:sulfite exporter TauE/SafE/copper chaperone CopZ
MEDNQKIIEDNISKISIGMQKTFTFHISGMHCKSCELLSESELSELPEIISVKANMKTSKIEVIGGFQDENQESIAMRLTEVLKKHGYTISLEPIGRIENIWSDFKIALPIAFVIIASFFLLQKMGLVNLIYSGSTSYGTIFVVGIVASLSSCMAVVGGLVLSMSATFASSGNKMIPQTLFHVGRLISFFILGGLLGAIGSTLAINSTVSLILGFVVGIVMFILGLNLLGIFQWTKYITPSMPRFISKHAIGVSKLNHSLTPLFVGIVTFFLPCGFTQSMQIIALSTGSFFSGALTMLVFALGTLPVLALISFSSVGFKDKNKSRIFLKTAGLIVIAFAILNLLNALVASGFIRPIFNF